MWAKSVPCLREGEAARYQPVMEHPDRPVWLDQQNDDIALHEALRRLEAQGDRWRVRCDRLELIAHLFEAHRRRERSRTRRSRQGQAGRLVPGQLRLVAIIDGAHALAKFARLLGQHEAAGQRQASPVLNSPAWTS